MSISAKMNGQWVGSFTGESEGSIVVDVDERESNYQGTAYLLEGNGTLPSSLVFFRTPNKEAECSFRTDLIRPIDPTTGFPTEWENISKQFPNVAFSRYADVKSCCGKDSLKLSWTTEIGVTGECVLPRSQADRPSELVPLVMDWERFKKYVSTLKPRQYLFRGQNGPWRLRTCFHRSGRANLHRFITEDIPSLYKHITAKTRHVFNLENPDQNGAFFNLIQHHGYPTPLLDWTYSPYVAAFFAYRGISNEKASIATTSENVRIHVFNQQQWRDDWTQFTFLIRPALHVSIGEFIAIENDRMIPQQSASIITNVDDIETYIKTKESETKKYLSAIDLPVRDRSQVVCELSYMGITAGSLFPGLDGACEELKQRNFNL